MAVWSIIDFKHIQKKNRLDSEYYQPEYLKLEELMKQRGDLLRLQDVTSVIGGKRLPKGETFSVKGIPYVRTVDIKNIFTDFDKVQNIPNEIYQVLKRYQLKYKDILVTIVGSIGLIGYMQEDISPCNFTENCAVVRSKKVSPEFLLAVLISKIGQYQINREKVGTIQDKLALDRLRNFLIPKAKSKALEINIENNIKQANENYKKSKLLYSQAEQILLEELGLKNLDLKDDLFCTTTLKEVKDNNRMDTEYYMPKYDCISKAIEKEGYNRLDSISKFSKILLKKKSEIFYKYIEIGEIDVSTGDVSCKEMQGCDLPTNAKLKISGGELIISKVRPTRGAIAIVPDYLTNNCLCSGAFSVFTIKPPIREYIQVFLRSKIGKVLLGHDSTGTQYPTITDEDVKAIPIPDLSKNIMENISNKVFNAHMERESAKALLEQAKHKVEEMIEKEAGVK